MTTLREAQALIIGIADYRDIGRLPATVVKDAKDVYAAITDVHICGYPAENVEVLLDRHATQQQVLAALARLAARSHSASTVFIYFSGHGGHIPAGPDAGEYLLLFDTECKHHASGAALALTSAISGSQLTAAIAAITAQQLVVIFDCCHSGGIGQPKEADGLYFKSGLPDSYLQRLATGRGRVILSSSRNTEASWILPGATNSLFTQHLLAGLLGGVPSSDGLVRIFDLFEYLQPRVTRDQPAQHPVFKGEVEENFPIALYLGGSKSASTASDPGYRFDVYISWVRAPDDSRWLQDRILPLLRKHNLSTAMTGLVDEPGVAWVVTVSRAIQQAKRTLLLVSRAYVASQWANFENEAAQQLSLEQRQARLLPVIIDDSLMDVERHLRDGVPLHLRQLAALDLTDELFGADNLARLATILQRPIPRLR